MQDVAAGELRAAYAEQKLRELAQDPRFRGEPVETTLVLGSERPEPAMEAGKKRSKAGGGKKPRGATLALMEKWGEDKEEKAQRKAEAEKNEELDKWATEQALSGAAEDNPNFAPLGGDWRSRCRNVSTEDNEAGDLSA